MLRAPLRRAADARASISAAIVRAPAPVTRDAAPALAAGGLSFLHLEKTGGTSLTHAVATLLGDRGTDPDPHRAVPPHLLSAFPPSLELSRRDYGLVWGHYDLPALRRLDPARFVFTVLREPRARILSLYHYWRSLDLSVLGANYAGPHVLRAQSAGLLEFLRTEEPTISDHFDNLYVRRLTGIYATGSEARSEGDLLATDPEAAIARALDALGSIDVIGLTDRMDESVARLARALGIDTPPAVGRLNVGFREGPGFRRIRREPVTEAIEAALEHLTRLDRLVFAAATRGFDTEAGAGQTVARGGGSPGTTSRAPRDDMDSSDPR